MEVFALFLNVLEGALRLIDLQGPTSLEPAFSFPLNCRFRLRYSDIDWETSR